MLQEVGERLGGDEDGHGGPEPDDEKDAERPRLREVLAVESPIEDEGEQLRARHAHDARCEPLQAENAVVEQEGDQAEEEVNYHAPRAVQALSGTPPALEGLLVHLPGNGLQNVNLNITFILFIQPSYYKI